MTAHRAVAPADGAEGKSAASASEPGVRTTAGIWMHVDPRDRRARRLVAAKGDLNPQTMILWKLLLGERRWTHVIDVGANYGEMLANGGLPEEARIFAVEPNPRVRNCLKRTLAGAGIGARILEVALSDSEGTAELIIDREWSGKSKLTGVGDLSASDSAVRTVATTTLAALLHKVRPRRTRLLVKIDVEGGEAAVLRGAGNLPRRCRSFAALVEILHLLPEERAFVLEHFSVELYDLAAKRLDVVAPGSVEGLDAMLATKRYHVQDAVLRAKPSLLARIARAVGIG